MSPGQQLYEIWRNGGSAWMDDWHQLTNEARNDWETFAESLTVDYGLKL